MRGCCSRRAVRSARVRNTISASNTKLAHCEEQHRAAQIFGESYFNVETWEMDLGPLAVIVLAHALLAVAQGESGFGSGEEGSAGDVCKPPNPRPEPIGVSIDTATIEPRCHLACIERVHCLR